MQRVVKPVYWQIAIFAAVILLLVGIGPNQGITGMIVSEPPGGFAAPYDPWTGEQLISLSLDSSDANSFSATATISGSNHAVYKNAYYYTSAGWQRIDAASDWTTGSGTVSIQDSLANIPEDAGDDLYVAAWICTAQAEEWVCGCKAPDDCGYWYVQSIELPEPCIDDDGDGYCSTNDCNDLEDTTNPGANEVCGDGIDQDCDGKDLSCPIGLFSDDFESGNGQAWDYLNPYAKVNSDLPQDGQYSLNFQYAIGTLHQEQHAEIGIAKDHLFHRYYIYFEQDFIQPISDINLASFNNVQQSARRWQGDVTRALLTIDGQDTSGVLQNGAWYCIEVEVDAGQDTATAWINGNQVFSGSVSASSSQKLIQGGAYQDTLKHTPIHSYVDDVVIDTERIGC